MEPITAELVPLSNYEVLFAFYETGHLIANNMSILMTVLGGFMVAGVLFGQLLDRVMTLLFVGVYAVFYLIIGGTLIRQLQAYFDLIKEIRIRAAGGTDFSWHGAVSVPDSFIAVGPWPLVLVVGLAFAGSLVFFFRTRRLDPKEFR